MTTPGKTAIGLSHGEARLLSQAGPWTLMSLAEHDVCHDWALWLTKQEPLECWDPGTRALDSCFNGTVESLRHAIDAWEASYK